jgi:hypothetical protein
VSSARTTRVPNTTIKALKRVFFEVDFDLIGHEYCVRKRTTRAIKHSRISWIYLHGIELEKGNTRYWLCKPCYDVGKSKVLVAASTGGVTRHLHSHGITPPGGTAIASNNTTMDTWIEGVHPLAAERWREAFVNWITYDNISFAQAASPWLRKVILGGGPHVQHLLPCANTVRTWLVGTYSERIDEVKASLARSRSRIMLSFDA